jgi:two-component system, NtrC family, nitrogen regulation response regulator GlnG
VPDPLNVWLVDDDASIRWVLERALKNGGMQPRAFEQADRALEALARGEPDVLITDIRMPGMSGLKLLDELQAAHPKLPVIVMTAHSDLDSAVAAYQGGAFEYLPKPFDIDEAVALVRRAAQQQRSSGRCARVAGADPRAARAGAGDAGGVSRDRTPVALVDDRADHRRERHRQGAGRARAAPAQPARAEAVHRAQHQRVHGDLLESELFGHEKGAFTGADTLRRGRFEQADGGTLFLDEIGDMSPQLQTRLLRVLAEGEFYRVGGNTPIRVDVRVIAATHQDLDARTRTGQFREDLLHRLNVIRIELPPLRARREDIPDLLRHYLGSAARELNVDPKVLTSEAERLLIAADWPGNVRQLVNTCGGSRSPRPAARSAWRTCRRNSAASPPMPRTTGRARSSRGRGARGTAGRQAAARRGTAGVRAHADPRRAREMRGAAAGRGEGARVGQEHAHAEDAGAGDGGG